MHDLRLTESVNEDANAHFLLLAKCIEIHGQSRANAERTPEEEVYIGV